MKRDEFIRSSDALAVERPLLDLELKRKLLPKAFGKGKKILDLGCNRGEVSEFLKKKNNEVFGVELNPKAAEEARRRGVEVKVFDLNEGIPHPDSTFDAIYAGEILGQVFDTKFLMEECNRVLKSDGFMILTVANLNSLRNRLEVLRGGYLKQMGAYPEDHFGDHIRLFNLAKLRELAQQTGFRIGEVTGLPASHDWRRFASISRLLPTLAPAVADVLFVKVWRVDN